MWLCVYLVAITIKNKTDIKEIAGVKSRIIFFLALEEQRYVTVFGTTFTSQPGPEVFACSFFKGEDPCASGLFWNLRYVFLPTIDLSIYLSIDLIDCLSV